MSDSYCIIRFYRDSDHPDHRMIVASGLTEAEAKAHCQDPSTREDGVWFDGWDSE